MAAPVLGCAAAMYRFLGLWHVSLEVPGLPQLPADDGCALRSLSAAATRGRSFSSGSLLPNDGRAASAHSLCGRGVRGLVGAFTGCLFDLTLSRGLLVAASDCGPPESLPQQAARRLGRHVEFVWQGFPALALLQRGRRVMGAASLFFPSSGLLLKAATSAGWGRAPAVCVWALGRPGVRTFRVGSITTKE